MTGRSLFLLFAAFSLLGCGSSDDGASPGGGGSGGAGGSGGSAGAAGMAGAGGSAGQGDALEAAVRSHDWTKMTKAPTVSAGKQDDVFFVSPTVGYLASGPKGAVYKTDDAGETWAPVLTSSTAYFRSVLFTSEQHGFAGNIGAGLAASISDATLMYETSDAGQTWNPVTNITGSAAKGLCNFTAVDADHLFGIGRANGPAHLLVSENGGKDWVAKDMSSVLSMAIDARFTSPTTGLVVGMSATGAKCTVVKTTDAGDSFSTVFTSDTVGSLCWKIQFPSEQVGYVAVQDSTNGPATFAKTTDGGDSWSELPLPGDGSAYAAIGVGFINEKIGWMAPEEASQPVYRTFDGGETWEEDPALKAPINRFRFIDDHTAIAVGGAVWKLDLAK